MSIDEVRVLVEKFSSGVSTLDEERQLADFFRNAKELPMELLPYKQMFAYFDDGMADGSLLADDSHDECAPARHAGMGSTRRKPVWRIIAVAATVAAVVTISYKAIPSGDNAPRQPFQEETVAQSVRGADTLSVEQDTVAPSTRGTELPEKVRQSRKWLYKPAPPKALLAESDGAVSSDSINEAAARMACDEIEKFEQEQQYMLNLVRAINIINSAEIASVADEVDAY